MGLLLLLGFAEPVMACGCGIYIPREGDANVGQERALVRWDGAREDIVMSLGVLGQSQEAAIILPIPSRAEVKLAPSKLFDELAEMTKPLVRDEVEWTFGFGGGVGAMPDAVGGAPRGVNVLSRQNIGPFDVANLAATDKDALKNWLDENDFQLDASVIDLMQPYVDENWTFVAVRLRPENAGQELGGELQPLWISFASDKLVYPMRASANADNSQTLYLYVLAAHRIEKQNAFGESRVSYADWIEPANVSGSALAPLVTRKFFLTKFIDTVNPAQVNDDFKFSVAPQDTQFREVTIRRVKQDATPFVLLACFVALILGVSIFAILFVMNTRRRAVVG
ncbi:MAG: hypothetical protein BroJett039_03030 [Chloroflexota bacterium]|nr:MAG: hypothetical protein BroJett039_03030 [Chloroflexota bacterium]